MFLGLLILLKDYFEVTIDVCRVCCLACLFYGNVILKSTLMCVGYAAWPAESMERFFLVVLIDVCRICILACLFYGKII